MKTISAKQIWLIAYPILLSLLMEQLIGMTDTAFLGRLDGHAAEVALGASALGNVYYLAIFLIGLGFSVGAQILIGRRNGEGNHKAIGPIFQQSAFFLFVLAAIVFVISKTASPYLLTKLINSGEVAEAMMQYLDWRIYSFFFAFLASIFRAFYVGTTNTKILTLNAAVMVSSNVVLNYALIFGKWGLPAMGIAGAAIASSIAELVSLLFFVIYTFYRIDWRKYGLFSFSRFEPKILKEILNISVWTMIQQFLAISTWFFFFIAIEHLGERPLAITNLVRSISALNFILIGSLATTTNTIVSNLLGAGQSKSVIMEAVWKVIRMCYLLIIPVMAVMLIFPEQLMQIFTNNQELIRSAVPSLRVMASAALIGTPGFIWFNAISGSGNTRSAFFLEIVTLTGYVIYTWYVVVHSRADVAVCWTTEHVYGILLFTLCYLYMRKANWQSKKI